MMLCLGFCSKGPRPGMFVPREGIRWLLLYCEGGKQTVDLNQISGAAIGMSSALCESLLYLIYRELFFFNFPEMPSQHSHSFGYSLPFSFSFAQWCWPALLGSIMSSVIAVRPCAPCFPSLLCGRLMRIGEISMPLLDMSHTLRC